MAVRQTGCRYCGLDVENFWPYLKGEWRDRGNNTHCNDGKHQHAPYVDLAKQLSRRIGQYFKVGK